jgi:MFS family permease
LNPLSLSGLAAALVANGIGRFAYVALMPVLIQQAWFNRTEAASLGSATLLGYLAGAPLTNWLSRCVRAPSLMRVALLTCSASYLACAWQGGGFAWFYVWRLLAGLGGALAMVLAPYLVLSRTPSAQRGRVSGVVFSGIGVGVMASGTVVPILVEVGLVWTWLVLGGMCLLLTGATWTRWPEASPTAGPRCAPLGSAQPLRSEHVLPVALLLAAYALNAVGYLPHTLFWVDYITRELHWSLAAGGLFWAVFGIAAAGGPFVTGALADRFGFSRALLGCFLLKALGVALPLANSTGASLFCSSVLVGMFTPGIAALVSGYTMALVGVGQHKRLWGWMTFSFAAAQGTTALWMVFVMRSQESYQVLFAVSAWALVASALFIACLRAVRRPAVEVHEACTGEAVSGARREVLR